MPADFAAPPSGQPPAAPPPSTEIRIVPVLNGWIILSGTVPVAIATTAGDLGAVVVEYVRAQLAAFPTP